MSAPIRVRPFREALARESPPDVREVIGRVEGGRFIVAVIGYEVGLDTVEVGQDRYGPYAWVNPGEHRLPNGYRVRVESEVEEHLPPSGVIALIFDGAFRDEVRQWLSARGLAPTPATLLAPHHHFFSVYFDDLGVVNGRFSADTAHFGEPRLN